MKKIYMTPEMEEIEIKNNMTLLAGSGIGTDGLEDLDGFGGDGSGKEPDAPGLPGMPDFGPGSVLGFPF